jgi:hypothetical protein
MPMKVYNLSCDHDHRFEGWFSSEADFCAQAEKGLIECPVCGSCSIERMPSAPRLNLSGAQEPQSANLHEKIQAHIMNLVREVVANSEDVGVRFAEEARKIHYKEAPERAIRGVASASECEALVEEGIDVTPLPLPDPLKEPLH